MTHSLGRLVVLVLDYDDALIYYTSRLGFEVIHDSTGPEGLRFVHVGLPGQQGTGIWFMKAFSDDQIARVGNQTGGYPLCVLYTDNCRSAYATLVRQGVTVHGEPQEGPDDVVVHFEDLYGNRFVLAELRNR